MARGERDGGGRPPRGPGRKGGRGKDDKDGKGGGAGSKGTLPGGAAQRSLADRLKALRSLWPFLLMVWRIAPGSTAATMAIRLVQSVQPVAMLYVGKLIIDEVVSLSQRPDKPAALGGWLDEGLLTRLAVLVTVELALNVLADIAGRIGRLVDDMLSERVTDASSVRLMEHAATLDLAEFENPGFQDRLSRARSQASYPMSVMWALFTQIQSILTAISFGAGLVVFAPWLIALLALSLVPAFLGEAHFSLRRYYNDYYRTPLDRERDHVRYVASDPETAKEIKIFGLSGFLVERYRRIAAELFERRRRLAVRHAGWGGLFTAIGTLGYSAAYAYIAWRTVSGQISIGDLTFLAGSFQRLHDLVGATLNGFSRMTSDVLRLDDLFSFFETRPRITAPADPRPFPDPIREGFVFEDVGFQYPGSDKWVVRHLSFTLRAGEVLALVGENGAGKTTLVKLLTRLYDPIEGRILLDGRDLREYDPAALRSAQAAIFQDFVRFSFSASDNIAAGEIAAREDRPRVERAAWRSQADEVVAQLPGGYDQRLGKRFDDSVDLSGGQWQKIAIARAYMRDAPVLILDEPTAALDARAEYEVFKRFKELMAGRCAVLISHRFSSVRMADRILVLADGTVEAQGTHQELLAQGGRYAELFELQAAGYR